MRRDTNTLRSRRGPLTADVVLANQDADKGNGADCGAPSAQAASLLPAIHLLTWGREQQRRPAIPSGRWGGTGLTVVLKRLNARDFSLLIDPTGSAVRGTAPYRES
jgi:hypothetical protein